MLVVRRMLVGEVCEEMRRVGVVPDVLLRSCDEEMRR
jgi:hypothetical protein